MKRLFSCGLLVLACLCARAQSYTLLSTATNAVPNKTTNSVASSAIELLNQDFILVYVECSALTNGGISNFITRFQGSIDGTNYFTNGAYSVTNALNGTNTVYGWTRFDVTQFRHLKQTSFENFTTNDVTNIVIHYVPK